MTADRDRAHAYLNGTDYEPVAESLKQVFGIQNFSPVYKIGKSVPALISAVQKKSCRIFTKKGWPSRFPADGVTILLSSIAANSIKPWVELSLKRSQVSKPRWKNRISTYKSEIREEAAYISYETIKGAGGLPVGTSGKGMLMLSGGIDSPVAGYLALKRGWISKRFTLLAHLILARELLKSPRFNS